MMRFYYMHRNLCLFLGKICVFMHILNQKNLEFNANFSFLEIEKNDLLNFKLKLVFH
jgi:hypothetical protein